MRLVVDQGWFGVEGEPVRMFSSIQGAVNAAAENDQVDVHAQVFTEQLNIPPEAHDLHFDGCRFEVNPDALCDKAER